MPNATALRKIEDTERFIDWLKALPRQGNGHQTVRLIFDSYIADQQRKLNNPFTKGSSEHFEKTVLARALAEGIAEELGGAWAEQLEHTKSQQLSIVRFLEQVTKDLLVSEFELATTVPRLDLPISRYDLWTTWPEYLQRLISFDEAD